VNFDGWANNGGADAAERAGRIYQETLDEYEQPPIDDAVRDELRDYVAKRRIELGDEPIPTPAF
jgi:trimethylamine--corrinoid protein Co-methyltransferase